MKPKAMGKISSVRLSWALTIRKAQGQTIRTKIILHLGKDEREQGITYSTFQSYSI